MPRFSRILSSDADAGADADADAAAPPAAVNVQSDLMVILAALLCALLCVVGLILVARCACIRRVTGGSPSSDKANKGVNDHESPDTHQIGTPNLQSSNLANQSLLLQHPNSNRVPTK
ncbi:hypothetical protein NC651_018292 [Populus alba x Populus x berolinensis]|nr:hypothetical protein NC651_018292 [Populus alba x Populus x berolinensis]